MLARSHQEGIGVPLGLISIIRNEQQRLSLFNAELSRGRSVAERDWGVADPPYTSEAEGEREHSAVAGLSSQTDSSSSFLSSARTGGTFGYHRDPNR